MRGWVNAAIIFVFAVVFNTLVRLTGALYVPIAVHFVYDAIAGFAYQWLWHATRPAPVIHQPPV